MGVIVDLIIIAIVALSTYLAYKKGLVALAIKLCAVVISIVITLLLYKPVSNLIINTTSIDETIQNAILEKATDVIRQDEESDLSNEVIDFAKDGVLDVKARCGGQGAGRPTILYLLPQPQIRQNIRPCVQRQRRNSAYPLGCHIGR